MSPDDGYVDDIDRRRGTDSSDKKLRDMKPVPGLEASTEFESYMHRLADHRVLSRQEERELSKRYHAGDKRAGEQLILHNTRLVIAICRRYSRLDYEFEDLIQEGLVGMHRAVEKFDPDRGIKFSTYATWWIRQALQRYMQTHGNTIRVPAHLQDAGRKVKRLMDANYGMTLEEACKKAEVDIQDALDALEGPRVTASLDAAVTPDGGDEGRHALIADDDAVDPLELLAAAGGRSGLRAALESLPELQRRVLELRFGIGAEDEALMPKPRDEVATELGVGTYAVQTAQKEGLAALLRALGDPTVAAVDEDEAPDQVDDEAAVFESLRRQDEDDDGDATCTIER